MKRLGIKLLVISICLVLAVMLVLPACAPAPVAEGKQLTIGLILPYTGFASPWSAPHSEAAVRLKLDEIGWKIAGRPIKLVTEDEASDPQVAVEKAKKLVETDKAEVLMGGLFGPVTIALAQYASQAGVCYGGYIQESMEALRANPNNTILPFGTLAGGNVVLGNYAYDVLKYRTATTVFQDFVAGEEYIGGFEQGFKDKGGTIVQRQAVPLGTADFAPYLTNLKEADCLAFWFAGTMNIFLGQYYDFKIKTPVVVPASWCLDMEPLIELGDKPLGIYGCGHANEWVTNLPLNAAFVKAMYDRGKLPVQYAYSIYVTTATFLEALKNTGGDTTPAKLHAAWVKVKMDTPAGVISFDEQGCAIGNLYLYQYDKNDKGYYWKTIKEFPQVPMKCKGIDY